LAWKDSLNKHQCQFKARIKDILKLTRHSGRISNTFAMTLLRLSVLVWRTFWKVM
jgi:hypothetical protein